MTDARAELSDALGVPVVDGVQAAVLAVRSLVTMGLATSKSGEFAAPPAKRYAGLAATLAAL
jgi:allantoin racemase